MREQIMEKVALVTGSSSGIGYETSLSLAREGYFTYASMRYEKGRCNKENCRKRKTFS